MLGLKCTAGLLLIAVLCCQLHAQDASEIEEELNRACRRISKVTKISQIERIIELLKQSPKASNGWLSLRIRRLSNKGLCRDQAETFLDLEPILAEKKNVCLKSHIDKIEEYHRKHFNSLTSTKIIYDFFKNYAYQVSFICKRHLWHSLNVANEKYVKPEDYLKVMPWLSEVERCEQVQTEMRRKDTSPEKIRCHAINAIARINTYTELANALGVESPQFPPLVSGSVLSEDHHSRTVKPIRTTAQQERLFLVLPEDKRDAVEQMLDTCDHFESIYEQTVMPIVRMAQMGYDIVYKQFLLKCAQEEIIRRWFSITLICKSMKSSRIADNKYVQESKIAQGDENKCVIVQDFVETNNEKPRFTEPERSLFENPIEDEVWIADYIPGRLGQLQTEISRRIFKALSIEEMDKYILFKKKVKFVRDSSIKLTIVGLSLIGLNTVVG